MEHNTYEEEFARADKYGWKLIVGVLLLIGGFVGFLIGRGTAPKEEHSFVSPTPSATLNWPEDFAPSPSSELQRSCREDLKGWDIELTKKKILIACVTQDKLYDPIDGHWVERGTTTASNSWELIDRLHVCLVLPDHDPNSLPWPSEAEIKMINDRTCPRTEYVK